MPPSEQAHVVQALARSSSSTRGTSAMCAPDRMRQADDVHVFLQRGFGDHLGRLAQAGVDDLHAGVAQGAGDDLGAAVVAVEAGLGDQDTDFAIGFGHCLLNSAVRSRAVASGTPQRDYTAA